MLKPWISTQNKASTETAYIKELSQNKSFLFEHFHELFRQLVAWIFREKSWDKNKNVTKDFNLLWICSFSQFDLDIYVKKELIIPRLSVHSYFKCLYYFVRWKQSREPSFKEETRI